MTVCIATIYGRLESVPEGDEAGKEFGIIVTSDRMVTYERGAFTYEGKTKKIKYYKPNSDVKFVLMGTGAVNYIEDFFRRFSHKNIKSSVTLEDITKIGAEVSGTMARDSIEATYLRPLSLTWDKLYKKTLQVPDPVTTFITEGIKELGGGFQDGLHILIAGIDKSGPHIFLIEDFDYTEVGTLGYHAVGMGDKAARVSLESNNYAPYATKNESILLSLIAKFSSEKAFGVGKDTDCGILRNNGKEIDWITSKQINKIRDIYESQMIPAFSDLITQSSNKLDAILNGGK